MALDLKSSSRLIESRTITFRAMGTLIEISVWANPVLSKQLVKLAPIRIEILEQSWSRFRDLSELNRINSLTIATSLPVSADMAELLIRMKDAKELTNGAYFPHVLGAMQSIGYDRNFENIPVGSSIAVRVHQKLQTRNYEISDNKLTFTEPLLLDAGGIGKGLAGDIITREFLALGAVGVLANIGGDLVGAGLPGDDIWRLGVTNDADQNKPIGFVEADQKNIAIATSSTVKRRWGVNQHHIIDPTTGNSAKLDISQISVVTSEGWRAEALTKAAMLQGFSNADAFLSDYEVGYLIVSSAGKIKSSGVQLC